MEYIKQRVMIKDKEMQEKNCQTSNSQGRGDEGYTTGFKHRADA